jgi:chemotaxis protein MotB
MPRPGLLGGDAYRDPFEPEFWAKEKANPEPLSKPVEPQVMAQPMPEKIEQPKLDVETAEETIAAEIKNTLGKGEGNAGDGKAPQIAIEAGNGSVTVNLTDGADYAMFELGSARPKREVIALVGRIAAILNSKPGMIEIAGHTDARPFKSVTYDNWRLSSARAQMAYYMLVQAGVMPERFSAIIGHASAKPRLAGDPLAPENRRIEITLVTPPSPLKPVAP